MDKGELERRVKQLVKINNKGAQMCSIKLRIIKDKQ